MHSINDSEGLYYISPAFICFNHSSVKERLKTIFWLKGYGKLQPGSPQAGKRDDQISGNAVISSIVKMNMINKT
ncbi:hypothetical protein [Sporocytophaga myxococcoides]|uniref:hypothetical protein n=1 Tax=Sporocytophaga myxococcoides TaxID=153721 RepID=UPI0003F73C7A|nr:hypothetical protein [Sporocytophaga myxococcoides]